MMTDEGKKKRLHYAAASESVVNLRSYLESDVHYPKNAELQKYE